jgi:ribulose-phosphate 3-epimerase
VAQARAWLDENDLKAELQVDGGVKVENIAELANAGASIFVAGTSVYNDKASPAENLAVLQARLREVQQSA